MNVSKNDDIEKRLSDTTQSGNDEDGIGNNNSDQRDVIIHHLSSSFLSSPKRLSPRSSSHSVSFSLNESVSDDSKNNNKNRFQLPSTSSTTITQQQQHLDSPNMPNLPKPSPNTLPLLETNIVPGHTNETSPMSHRDHLNEDELPLPPPPPPSSSLSTSTTPPPPSPLPPPLFLSSSKCTTNQSKHQESDNVDGAVSHTNSNVSIPDYLSHKLHSQLNITSNILKSKRKSIAVSSMLRHGDHFSSGTNFNIFRKQQQHHATLPTTKESYDSSTSTTTSESYRLNDLPALPAKLATLSKPPITPFFNSSFRRARHSIDVRALPSYLAKKRHSTFGQLLSGWLVKFFYSFSTFTIIPSLFLISKMNIIRNRFWFMMDNKKNQPFHHSRLLL
ncbi:hypothetical protein BLA29_004793 [Euroglyphus maynei]|uniref:Uncharacterized protein n=1 Tax=Euroglyphus maynei TaxID=6958 RepID=A0A1Y3AYH2_EURMA|nr:hypothetical protein BLA29_004793 [Euroglyphus maynei]